MWDLANIRNAATHAIRIIAPIRVHFVSAREKSSGRLFRRFAFRFRFPHSPPAHHCLPVFRYRSSWMTRVARLAAACSATEGLPSLRRSASQIESLQKFSPPLRTDRPVLELLLSLFLLPLPPVLRWSTPTSFHAPRKPSCSNLARSLLNDSGTARGTANAMAI